MKTIAISSFKGGTAKTSVSLHLAAALALYHKQRVLAIDFDAQANLTSGLGFDPDEQESMAPVLQGNRPIDRVILPTSIPNLSLIPADTWLERVEVTAPLAGNRYSHEKLKQVLQGLPYDIVLIDTPPSLCWLTESALIAANHALICATPEFYSVKGLQRLAEFMETLSQRHPLSILGVALSFWNPKGKNNHSFLGVVESTFPAGVLSSKIRRDAAVSEAAIRGKPIFQIAPKSRAAEDYLKLSTELLTKLRQL